MTLQELQGLISANKTQEAIAIMAKAIGDKNSQLRDDLVMLSSQISRNETLFIRGLIKTDDYAMAGTQSIRAILAILEEVNQTGYLENMPSNNADVDKNASVFVEKRTKIQFLAANPIDTSKLELEREYIEIRKIFKQHQHEFVLVERRTVAEQRFILDCRSNEYYSVTFTSLEFLQSRSDLFLLVFHVPWRSTRRDD